MTSKKSSEEESVFDEMKEKMSEIKENMEEKVETVKEKVNEGVDEVKKRTSNVLKSVKGEIDDEDEGLGSRTMVILALGCAAGSGFLAAKVVK